MPPRSTPDDVLALLPTVARWCARLGGPGIDADAATNDVILLVLARLESIEPEALLAYTYTVTRGTVANRRRAAWWRRWVPGATTDSPGHHTPLVDAQRRDVARRVAGLLDRLPAEQREVLVLCDVEDRSAAEVAALVGVPEGTVKSRLRLARARFRALAPSFHLHAPNGDE